MTKVSQRFKRWLLSHPLEDRAGERNSESSCPIARYLSSTTNYTVFANYNRMTAVSRITGATKVKHPEPWMTDFMELFDKQPYACDTYDHSLAVLEEIERRHPDYV